MDTKIDEGTAGYGTEPTDATLIAHGTVPTSRQSAVSSHESGPGGSGTALWGCQSMSEYEPDGDNVCPTCDKELSSERGAKVHHKRVHGESIAGIELTCEHCGASYRKKPHEAPRSSFCSQKCKNAWQSENWTGEDAPNWQGGGVKIVCEQCGEGCWRKPSAAEQSRFCSLDCQAAWRSENLTGADSPNWTGGEAELTCKQCGETYRTRKARANNSRFCSRECNSEWQSENQMGNDNPAWSAAKLVCEQCGGVFYRKQSGADRARFCSRDCRSAWWSENRTGSDHPNWQGGDFPYGEGWNEQKRELVRGRDGRECRVCGRGEHGHIEEYGQKHTVHHIVKARQLEDAPAELRNGMFNLVTMCRDHHIGEWERVPPLLQFMAFLPHPQQGCK